MIVICQAKLNQGLPAEINTDFPGIYVSLARDRLARSPLQCEKVKASPLEVTENRYTPGAGNCGQPEITAMQGEKIAKLKPDTETDAETTLAV